ncbi:uncharacterized protein ACN2A1_001283 isoform 1-T5 [Glossina fuscipes fuscipes]
MDKGIYNSHNNNSNNRSSSHYNQNNNIYILNSDQTILSHGTDIFNTNSSSYAGYHYGPIPQTLTNQSSKPLAYTSALSSLSSNVTPCTTSTASMCSPAANALQKLFKCSTSLMTNKSNHNTKHQNHHHRHRHHHSRLQQQQQQHQQQQQQQREQQPNTEHAESSSLLSRACIGSTYTFIGSNKTLKTNLSGNKSQLLAKKTKFWKLLENEGTKNSKSSQTNSNFKYWHECCNGDKIKHLSPQHKNAEDLWPLTCSLCDNCRCMDCQSGYFDYDYETDSDSEYSLHLSDNEFESQNFDLISLQKLDLTDDNCNECNECQRQLDDEGKRNQPALNNVKDNKINSYNSSKQKITNKSTIDNDDDESSSVCLLTKQAQNLNAIE